MDIVRTLKRNMFNAPSKPCVGILLAAGQGRRFDPRGRQNKLLQRLANGRTVAATAAANLLSAVPRVIAVVRPGTLELTRELEREGCEVITCETADEGMANSLVRGVKHVADASGWLIALADMPFVQRSTISAVADALGNGADIISPTYHGVQGNPVAFSAHYLSHLVGLTGDEGARSLLKSFFVTEISVDDPAVRRDIDAPEDLRFSLDWLGV